MNSTSNRHPAYGYYNSRKNALLYWGALLTIIAAGETVIWLFDSTPRFFLGDSAYYIWSAISGVIPIDRSFTYGKIISLLAGPQVGLKALILGQIMFAILGTFLLGLLLRLEFNVSPIIVAGVTLLMAFEPLHLAYERFIMTEAIATPVFALFSFLAVRYLNRPDWRLLAAMAAAGAVLISFRLNMMLLTWAIAFLLPLLSVHGTSFSTGKRPSRAAIRSAVKHIAAALVFTACAHSVYMAAFAFLRGGRPAYNYAEGLFALASFAPIVQKVDFSDPLLAEKVFKEITYPLTDLNLREAHRWLEAGLVPSLVRNTGGERKANRIARNVVISAMIRDPGGAIGIGIRTLSLYFDQASLMAGLKYDLGPDRFPIPELNGLAPYIDSLGAEVVGPSPARWWHVRAWPWYMFLMLCPLWAIVLFFATPPELRAHAVLIFALASGLLLTGPFLATMAVVRYLHPLSWLTLLTIALLLQAAIWRVSPLLKRPAAR